MSTKKIILELDVAVIDKIATILTEKPYREVKDIIDMIVMQANDTKIQSYCAPAEPLPQPEQEN